uniref:Uncharacterized protein n=1 Tax=Tetradesmus obliquus TaxID=3088 RepID=A0A383WLZ0_TETOB|eukprot:jgi/Sobl393_1/10399/SZX77756.1
MAIGNKIADLFTADENGKMIISAVGDGSQCLDGGDWPTLARDNCTMFDSSPFCQSTGILTYSTCSNAPWSFFKYNGKLSFGTGVRRLGRDFCVQAWACGEGEVQECAVRGAPCEWGGAQYNAFFSVDPLQRRKNGFTLFRIHFASKGEAWCLTNSQAGYPAKLRPCDGSDAQLWFVPAW